MEKDVKQKNIFLRWYKLCEPNKKDWALQLITYFLYAVITALMAIFTARTIDCLYHRDYTGAFIWLGIELLDIVARNVFKHFEFYYYGKTYGQINKTISLKIYNKILSCKPSALKRFSTEKLISIAQSNTSYACEFPDYVAIMLSKIVQASVALITIFITSYWAGLIVLALGTINFFVYRKLNKMLGYRLKRRFETKDERFKEYANIIQEEPVINEFGIQEDYKKKLFGHVDSFNKEYAKYYMTQSFKDQIYYIIWNIVVYAITAVLIILVSKDMFDLSLYLITVPYLTTCTQKLNDLYDKFGAVENTRVDVDRLELILSLNDKELIKYGTINKNNSGKDYNLAFANVSYIDKETPNLKLKNADINFSINAINIVRGERGCGKRIVFDMLRRQIKPDDGIVLLDNLNLYDYNPSTFKRHIDYCAQHPIFLRGTVRENLQVTKKDLSKLKSIIEELRLTEIIDNLPKKLDTNIDEITDEETRFWIGLIRSALSNCKVLMIYEYPGTDNPKFHEIFQNVIKTCETDKRTLILFTHKKAYDKFADKVFEITNGKVKQITK